MSTELLVRAFDAACNTPAEKLILVLMADGADYNNDVVPDIDELAVRVGQLPRSVGEHLAKLEDAGYLHFMGYVGEAKPLKRWRLDIPNTAVMGSEI